MKTIISQAVLALHVALCRLQRRQAIKIVLAVLTVHNLHHSHIQQHVIAHPVQPVQQVRINVQAKQVAIQPMEHVHYRRVMQIIINLAILAWHVMFLSQILVVPLVVPAILITQQQHQKHIQKHVIIKQVMRAQHRPANVLEQRIVAPVMARVL